MRKRSAEVWFHVACFVVVCILALVVQPIFLKYFGVDRIIIEESVAGGIMATIMGIGSFLWCLITDIRNEKNGY